MMELRYHYLARVTNVHDGDTVTCDIDAGFDVWLHAQRCRLLGINAPELVTPEGKAARAYLVGLLLAATPSRPPVMAELAAFPPPVYVVTERDHSEKYGRWLVTLYAGAGFAEPSLNQQMVDAGHAVRYPK